MLTLLISALQTPPMPFVSPMFSDHMVLQRDMKDPVWGWTTPGAKVAVSINGKTTDTVADTTGKWTTKIGPFRVGGPFQLTISGPQTVTFSDVIIGDVWLCSGQSNMEFGVGNLKNPAEEAAAANRPNIRLYAEPHQISASPSQFNPSAWQPCTSDTILKDGGWGGFSAVAYFFGAKLNYDINVPIGLIHSSWGGTPAEAWTREKELGDFPAFKGRIDQLAAFRVEQAKATAAGITDRMAAWYKKNDAGDGKWQDPALDDSDWKTMDLPNYFQKSDIPELNNNQSVVWFRKEIDIPAETSAAATTLRFYADDNDVTWVNGVQVGATDNPQAYRAYNIPAGTLKAGKNTIAFRITDTGQPGGIYGAPVSFFLQTDSGSPISLAGPWKVKLGVKVTQDNEFPSNYDQDPNYPTELYNGMIAPIAPFAIKGAIWYQGESNVGRAAEYRKLLPAMITSWRSAFDEKDFPFLIVQLAGFGHPLQQPGDDAWAELREAQFTVAKTLPHTGIATAIDIGEENDIHPKDKSNVGVRLARVAEKVAYGQDASYSGPTYRSMKIKGNAIEITFDNADGGFKVVGDVPLFSIAGEDHKWHWASGTYKDKDNKILVSSPDVPNPVAVRYNWAPFTAASLYNNFGFPAFPFRTDDWTPGGR